MIPALCLGALLMSLGVLGCQPMKKAEPATMPAVTPERTAQVRDSIKKNNPTAVTGLVIYTLTEDGKPTPDKNRPFTAVGDLQVADVKRGQTVTFVDVSSGDPVNNGVIQDIYTDSIGVRYDVSGKRPPMNGDVAVIFKD